jgi:hypothetical protein
LIAAWLTSAARETRCMKTAGLDTACRRSQRVDLDSIARC